MAFFIAAKLVRKRIGPAIVRSASVKDRRCHVEASSSRAISLAGGVTEFEAATATLSPFTYLPFWEER